MSKKIIKTLVIIIFVLILVVLAFYLLKYFTVKKDLTNSKASNTTLQLMNDDEKRSLNLYHLGKYEVVSRDANGKVSSYRFVGLKAEEPIDLKLMTDAEKAEKNIAASTKAQVLERDSSGKVAAYKIIKNDSDILKKY